MNLPRRLRNSCFLAVLLATLFLLLREHSTIKTTRGAEAISSSNLRARPKQGWPVDLSARVPESLTVADLNGDGQQETIAGTVDGTLYIFNADGSPFEPWPEQQFTGQRFQSIPAVGNLDDDPEPELVFALSNPTGNFERKIYAYNYDGTPVRGNWPIEHTTSINPGVSLSDLDGDGKDEVIGTIGYPWGVMVWKSDGSPFPGSWPSALDTKVYYSYPAIANLDNDTEGIKEIVVQSSGNVTILHKDGSRIASIRLNQVGENNARSPILGNIDGDDDLEIIVHDNIDFFDETGVHTAIRAFDWDGTEITSGEWPIIIKREHEWAYKVAPWFSPGFTQYDQDEELEILAGFRVYDNDGSFLRELTADDTIDTTVVSGDVNGDGNNEFFAQGWAFQYEPLYFHGWQNNGLPIDGLPEELLLDQFVPYAVPVLTDLEGDGVVDVLTTNSGRIYAWEIVSEGAVGNLDWPMFAHDPKHTGAYLPPQPPGDDLIDREANTLYLTIDESHYGNVLRFAVSELGRVVSEDVGDGMIGLLHMQETGREGFVLGDIVDDRPGTSPYDSQWHWHFDPSTIGWAVSTPEGCNVTLEGLESELDYWLEFNRETGPICVLGSVTRVEPLKISGTVERLITPQSGGSYLLRASDKLTFIIKSDSVDLGPYVDSVITATGNPSLSATNDAVIVNITEVETPSEEEIALYSGWNKIISAKIDGYPASQTLNLINKDCGPQTSTAISQLRNGFWETFALDYSGVDFVLSSTSPFYVRVNTSCTWGPP